MVSVNKAGGTVLFQINPLCVGGNPDTHSSASSGVISFFLMLQPLGALSFFIAVASMATVHPGWKREDEAPLEPSLALLWPAGGANKSSHSHFLFATLYICPRKA